MNDAPITPEQVKAARQLLGWSQAGLAGHVGASTSTIGLMEQSKPRSPHLNLDAVRAALESAGVVFITETGGGAGVRLRKGAK
jgi:DNA-binding XRE family transcriptional regulator